MTNEEYLYLKRKVMSMTGIDLDSYKSQQMRRRLSSFIGNVDARSVISYCHALERDEACLRKLRDFLTINVTEFFRDQWAFEKLKNHVLPSLMKNNNRLNIWSAGCSSGGEPFSLVILLNELTPDFPCRILATDVDAPSLLKANAGGPYNMAAMKNVPAQYISQYFKVFDGQYWVKDEIRAGVEFKQHNLLSDPFEKGFDLISCRNVTIYFTDEARNKLNQRFYEALKDGGFLFIGATEFVPDAKKLGFAKLDICFYQKVLIPFPEHPREKLSVLQTA
jgi:chemotaxis protein methyltransferase CheR